MDPKWTENRLKLVPCWTQTGPKMDPDGDTHGDTDGDSHSNAFGA